MNTCKYCGKSCKSLGLHSHERLCKSNPNRKKEDHPSFGRKGKNQYTKAKKLGIEFIPSEKEISGRTRRAILVNKIRWNTPNAKENHSKKIKEAINRNPEKYSISNISGRTKLHEYNGTKVNGTWELLFAKWLDSNNIKWTNKFDGFQYEWNGIRTYFPDFYLVDINKYVEVKGFIRDRDIEKWKVVPNLLIVKYSQILKIKENIFTLDDLMKCMA